MTDSEKEQMSNNILSVVENIYAHRFLQRHKLTGEQINEYLKDSLLVSKGIRKACIQFNIDLYAPEPVQKASVIEKYINAIEKEMAELKRIQLVFKHAEKQNENEHN